MFRLDRNERRERSTFCRRRRRRRRSNFVSASHSNSIKREGRISSQSTCANKSGSCMFAIYIEWVARCFLFSYTHAHTEDDDDCGTVIVHRVSIHHLFFLTYEDVPPSKAGRSLSSKTMQDPQQHINNIYNGF